MSFLVTLSCMWQSLECRHPEESSGEKTKAPLPCQLPSLAPRTGGGQSGGGHMLLGLSATPPGPVSADQPLLSDCPHGGDAVQGGGPFGTHVSWLPGNLRVQVHLRSLWSVHPLRPVAGRSPPGQRGRRASTACHPMAPGPAASSPSRLASRSRASLSPTSRLRSATASPRSVGGTA